MRCHLRRGIVPEDYAAKVLWASGGEAEVAKRGADMGTAFEQAPLGSWIALATLTEGNGYISSVF